MLFTGNGVCKCGMCGCVPGFNGTTCDCPTSVDTCTDSKSVSLVKWIYI